MLHRRKPKLSLKDIATVLRKYLQPRNRLVIAEQTIFVALTQRNGKSSGVHLDRLREAARFPEFGKSKTIADPEPYMIQLRFIAGLQNSEGKMKVLEYLQSKPAATIDDILLVIQHSEQIVQFVNNQSDPTESSFLSGTVADRRKLTGLVRKHTTPKVPRMFVRSVVQNGLKTRN